MKAQRSRSEDSPELNEQEQEATKPVEPEVTVAVTEGQITEVALGRPFLERVIEEAFRQQHAYESTPGSQPPTMESVLENIGVLRPASKEGQ